MNDQNSIKKSIESADLERSVRLFEAFFNSIRHIDSRDLPLLKTRLQDLNNTTLRNTETSENREVERNKITGSLIDFENTVGEAIKEFFPEFDPNTISQDSLLANIRDRFKFQYTIETPPIAFGKSSIYFRALDKATGQKVVIRALRRFEFSTQPGIKLNESIALDPETTEKLYRIKHRNIIKVLGIYLDRFVECMVLEYIHGIHLGNVVKAFPFSTFDVIRFLLNVGNALYYLHSQNLVHSRIRPSKILIDHELYPVISPVEIFSANSMNFTQGNLFDEACYGPPEFLSGENNNPGASGDQFSLAVVACEMLLGQPLYTLTPKPGKGDKIEFLPWDRKTKSVETVIRNRIRLQEDPDYRQAVLRKTGAPQSVINILSKMLQKNPEDRYKNIRKAMLELEKIDLAQLYPEVTSQEFSHIRIARASYERCCIQNPYFAEDFYRELMEGYPNIKERFRAFYALEAGTIKPGKELHTPSTGEFQQLSQAGLYQQFKMLKSAVNLLLCYTPEEAKIGNLRNFKSHQGIPKDEYMQFLDLLIQTIKANDLVWQRATVPQPNEMAKEIDAGWDFVKQKALNTLFGGKD